MRSSTAAWRDWPRASPPRPPQIWRNPSNSLLPTGIRGPSPSPLSPRRARSPLRSSFVSPGLGGSSFLILYSSFPPFAQTCIFLLTILRNLVFGGEGDPNESHEPRRRDAARPGRRRSARPGAGADAGILDD